MKKLSFLFLILGLICLVWLIHRIGTAVLISNLKQIGWGIGLIIFIELLVDALNTRGWRHTLPATAKAIPFLPLYCIRQAGVAINAITPTAMVGGEMLKAMLLKHYLPLSDGLASVISAKLSLALSQACFALLGITIFLHQLQLATALKIALLGVFLILISVCFLFLRLQQQGMFAAVLRVLSFFGVSPVSISYMRDKTSGLDTKLAHFHATQRTDFALSVVFHFLAQLLGAVQIFVLLLWLSVPTTVFTCLAVEAFSLLIEGALFFVPGKVGVQEGGKVLIFSALGFTTTTGLTVGIAMRLNYLAITLIGLLMLAALHLRLTPDHAIVDDTRPALHG